MKCPNTTCHEDTTLEVHHTDQFSTYYCQECGYEEKVIWDTPRDSPKRDERTNAPVRRKPRKVNG
jgi:Zn ribbon nucleic-acid-binding protein